MEIIFEIVFYTIASIACFGIAGLCEAIMDTLQFHYESSIFYCFKKKYFWDPKISWYNKYKNKDEKPIMKTIKKNILSIVETNGKQTHYTEWLII